MSFPQRWLALCSSLPAASIFYLAESFHSVPRLVTFPVHCDVLSISSWLGGSWLGYECCLLALLHKLPTPRYYFGLTIMSFDSLMDEFRLGYESGKIWRPFEVAFK